MAEEETNILLVDFTWESNHIHMHRPERCRIVFHLGKHRFSRVHWESTCVKKTVKYHLLHVKPENHAID